MMHSVGRTIAISGSIDRGAIVGRDGNSPDGGRQRRAGHGPAVMLWGFSDRYSWVPGISRGTYDHALIYDRDYRPKPAYEAIAAALR